MTSTATSARTTPSPLGELTIVVSDAGVRSILFPVERPGRVAPAPVVSDSVVEADGRRAAVLDDACRQLEEYFAGGRRDFSLPLDPVGTPFQLRVWAALRDIPYGATSTYGEQARRMGSPSAVRAVGAANGRNPISIVVPCHRVIGADGSLTGYAGGMDAKRLLLTLESADERLFGIA